MECAYIVEAYLEDTAVRPGFQEVLNIPNNKNLDNNVMELQWTVWIECEHKNQV